MRRRERKVGQEWEASRWDVKDESISEFTSQRIKQKWKERKRSGEKRKEY